MADDIFLTPEEQDERAKKWLKDNGMSIAVGIGLGLAAVFGYNQYKDSVQLKAEQASGLYDEVITTHENSEISDIDVQVQQLKNDYASSSYAAKAVLVKAKQLSLSDQQSAMNELQWVIDNASEVGLQHTARVRLAKLHYASGDIDAARKLASVQPSNGFDSHYQEILGDIERKQGNFETARGHYEKASEALGATSRGYAQVLGMKLSRLPKAPEVEAASDDVTDQDKAERIDNDGTESINTEAVNPETVNDIGSEDVNTIDSGVVDAVGSKSVSTVSSGVVSAEVSEVVNTEVVESVKTEVLEAVNAEGLETVTTDGIEKVITEGLEAVNTDGLKEVIKNGDLEAVTE